MRELVIANEQLLLRTLKYKVNLDLPYRYLYNYLRALNCNSGMAQIATNFINDTYASQLRMTLNVLFTLLQARKYLNVGI